MRLAAAARLRLRLVRRAMTFSAIARPLLIAAFTLSRERADRRFDLRVFFAMVISCHGTGRRMKLADLIEPPVLRSTIP